MKSYTVEKTHELVTILLWQQKMFPLQFTESVTQIVPFYLQTAIHVV